MAKYPGVSAFWDQPVLGEAPPPPDPDPVIRFTPDFGFNLASSIMANTGFASDQRARVVADIRQIATDSVANGIAINAHIAANWGWDDAETALGVYDASATSVPVLLQTMAAACIAGGAGTSPNTKWFLKLFFRNYNLTPSDPSSPCVPAYMRSSAGTAYAGTTGGTGLSANGEYEGEHKNAVSRNAKMWVPEVAARFQAWLEYIGTTYNDDPTFGGVIINETSQLPALPNSTTGMSIPGEPGVNPTDNSASTMVTYFQNFFGACVAARESLSKCELIISPNTPAEIWTASPLNPGILASDHKIGVYIQDGYKGNSPQPKFSVRLLYSNNQPLAISNCSYAVLLSGEVHEHKGVVGVTGENTTTTQSLTTGVKTFTIGSGKSITLPSPAVLLHDFNAPTIDYMTGTITAYNSTSGSATFSITTVNSGSGSRTGWNVGIGTNYMPPHTTDQMVEYALRPFSPGDVAWVSHSYAGASYVFLQTNSATSGTSVTAVRYQNFVAYLKATTRRVIQTRPAGYPAA
jgi:hypothetical protein